jgi:hypothetical protein
MPVFGQQIPEHIPVAAYTKSINLPKTLPGCYCSTLFPFTQGLIFDWSELKKAIKKNV